MTTRPSRGNGPISVFARGSLVVGLLVAMALLPSGVRGATDPYLVKDINPNGSSNPQSFAAMDGILFFAAKGDGKGVELWRSDGTSTGTRRVKDLWPGPRGSRPQDVAAIGGLLYFTADDGVQGRELWVSDGTGAGTRLVKDINSGPGGAWNGFTTADFTEFNGLVYFYAFDDPTKFQLWRTDATESGTQRVTNFSGGLGHPEGYLLTFAGKLYFSGPSWIFYGTDGTASGTTPLNDVNGHKVTDPYPVAVVGSRLYFGRYSNGDGDLWRSDGTAATTRQIGKVLPGYITGVGATAFISGRISFDLWKSNGTAASTLLVKNRLPGGGPTILFAGTDKNLFFDADYALWTSDGTSSGTNELSTADPVLPQGQSVAIGSVLYLVATAQSTSSTCCTVWRSDGTTAGTYSLGGAPAGIQNLTAVGSRLYWTSNAGGHGFELWSYVP